MSRYIQSRVVRRAVVKARASRRIIPDWLTLWLDATPQLNKVKFTGNALIVTLKRDMPASQIVGRQAPRSPLIAAGSDLVLNFKAGSKVQVVASDVPVTNVRADIGGHLLFNVTLDLDRMYPQQVRALTGLFPAPFHDPALWDSSLGSVWTPVRQ